MSQFEFVVVLFSLVVAFGVSELLAGWGKAYASRIRRRPYGLQIVATALLLIALLQSLWGYWGFRDVEWTFWLFLIALSPLLVLVAATYLITPDFDLDSGADARTHYFSVAPGVMVLLATWIALGAVAEFTLVSSSFHLGQAVRVVGVGLLLALSRSSQPIHHWLGYAALAILQFSFVRIVTETLS